MNKTQKTIIMLLAGGALSLIASCAGPTQVGNYGGRPGGSSQATMGSGKPSGGGGGGGTTTSQLLGRQRGLTR